MARPNIVMKLEGGEALRKELLKKQAEFIAEMATVLPIEAAKLMAQGKAAAPKDSGKLAESASVTTAVTRKGSSIKAAAAFLDEKAAAVHEGVHWRKHVEGTKGFKWFERVFHAFEPGFVQRIADRLRRLVG